MKRIEFIAPVESMRGNLGTRQDLVYAPNNNRAFDSIEGQLNPALNYEPRLIGAKGRRNYFCVKTKSAVNLTPRMKSAMAEMGGVGAVYSALVRDKSSQLYQDAQACWRAFVEMGYDWSFRKYMYTYIRPALEDKRETIDIAIAGHSVSIDNPWVKRGRANIQITNESLVKLWTTLADNPITFEAGSYKGVAHEGEVWYEYEDCSYNTVGANIVEIEGLDYVKFGDLYLMWFDPSYPESDGEYVVADDNVMQTPGEGEAYIVVPDGPNE